MQLLPGPDRGPFVHVAATEDVLRTLDRNLLTADESRRCARLHHPADRDARAAAHLLVRWSAARLTGRAIETLELVQWCPDCGSTEHGRPSLAGLLAVHVSLGRTRGAVVVGVDWDPIGVDIELARSGDDLDVAPLSLALTDAEVLRVRSAHEPAETFLRHWALKECLAKAGVATLDEFARIELDRTGARRTADGRTRRRHGSLHLVDWFDPGLAAVVAAAGFRPPVVGSFPAIGHSADERT